LNELATQIANLALQLEQQLQQGKQDRSQAAIDRAEFCSTVESLLQVLAQQYNGRTEPE
jgi:hypothetical protein